MQKIQTTRLNLTVYNKETKETTQARFYLNAENEVNRSIFNSLSRSLFGSKYGSTSVHEVKLSEVVNPSTEAPATVKAWDKEAGAEIDVPLMRLDSFSTGYNPEGENKPQNHIIQLVSVDFTAENDGKEYTVSKRFDRDFEGAEKGVVKNLEALTHMKEAMQEDGSVMATIGKADSGTWYISKFSAE